MEALIILATLLAVIVAVTGVVLTLRGFKPLEFELPGWVGNSVAWVKRIIK